MAAASPSGVSATLDARELFRDLRRLNPKTNRTIQRNALVEMGLLVQRNAAEQQIRPGGGRGPAVPGRLTSRTGALRRSIALNREPLPGAVETGTPLLYGPPHEFGSSRMPQRPFLAPALAAEVGKFESVFVKHWKRFLP